MLALLILSSGENRCPSYVRWFMSQFCGSGFKRRCGVTSAPKLGHAIINAPQNNPTFVKRRYNEDMTFSSFCYGGRRIRDRVELRWNYGDSALNYPHSCPPAVLVR